MSWTSSLTGKLSIPVCTEKFTATCNTTDSYWGQLQNRHQIIHTTFRESVFLYCQHFTYQTNSSLLTMITLKFAFKHINHIHSDAYKKRINKQNQRKKNRTFEETNIDYNIGGRIWILQYITPNLQRWVKVSLAQGLEIYIQCNLNGSNTDGSFTVDDSNSFFSPYKTLPIAQENKYLMIFFS